ncbi:polyhomeotic-like protein 1 [Camelus ferus]|uniref:Polyhomeotic-like protein 1 n=2 Tax=Camelus TaxID=9836 RepID=A0A8B8RP83_CAMFR|nr:polyhomeotic-like protein 1 [Camelus ferus]XP_045371786.1 polyhomeotic-like protein 1 [Camelus bactrianus]
MCSLEPEHQPLGPWATTMETRANSTPAALMGVPTQVTALSPREFNATVRTASRAGPAGSAVTAPWAQYFYQFMSSSSSPGPSCRATTAVQQASSPKHQHYTAADHHHPGLSQSGHNTSHPTYQPIPGCELSLHYHFDPIRATGKHGLLPAHPVSGPHVSKATTGKPVPCNPDSGLKCAFSFSTHPDAYGTVATAQQRVPSPQAPGVHAGADQVQNLPVKNEQASAQDSTQKTV